MVRSSLTTNAFSYLESYLEDRVFELMPEISKTIIRYEDMPPRFQNFVTAKAVKGLATRIGFDKSSALRLAEAEIRVFQRMSQKKKRYSAMGFSETGSNISAQQITEFLGDLGVASGWKFLDDIVKQVSYSSLEFQGDYSNLAKARNNSTHDPLYVVPSNDLDTYIKTAIRVGVSFDLAITHMASCYAKSPTALDLKNALAKMSPKICIIEEAAPQKWTVRLAGAGSVIASVDRQDKAERIARRTSKLIVVRDNALIPVKVL